jgi:hypothetical protein
MKQKTIALSDVIKAMRFALPGSYPDDLEPGSAGYHMHNQWEIDVMSLWAKLKTGMTDGEFMSACRGNRR